MCSVVLHKMYSNSLRTVSYLFYYSYQIHSQCNALDFDGKIMKLCNNTNEMEHIMNDTTLNILLKRCKKEKTNSNSCSMVINIWNKLVIETKIIKPNIESYRTIFSLILNNG
eukprot:54536_1